MAMVLRLTSFALVVISAGCVSVPYSREMARTDRASHVLVVPGVMGPDGDLLRVVKRLNSTDRSAEIWNWIEHPSVRQIGRDRLDPKTVRPAADDLAEMVRAWREEHPNTNLYLMASSGGALVVILASEELARGERSPHEPLFTRLFFASASCDRRRNVDALLRMTEGGLYNYYSDRDSILLIFRRNSAGRLGFAQQREGIRQLAFRATSFLWWLDNDGGHLKCYKPRFFEQYIEPLVTPGAAIPNEWR